MEEYKRRDGKNAKRYERTVTYDKICNICGEHFIAKVWNAKTCKKPECIAANAAIISATREQRYNNGELSSVLVDKEFICERCNKAFIKHTTNRKKFRYCDNCAKAIKEETYIYNKIQKCGTAACIVGSGGNQWGEKNNQYIDGKTSAYKNMPNDYEMYNYRKIFDQINPNDHKCYFCGLEETAEHLHDIHHVDCNHYNNSKENLMKLCRRCHIRLHKIYKYLHIHK